jgi:hypothetical protein
VDAKGSTMRRPQWLQNTLLSGFSARQCGHFIGVRSFHPLSQTRLVYARTLAYPSCGRFLMQKYARGKMQGRC